MATKHRNPPAKTRPHKNRDVDSEFLNVYRHLRKVDLGPFRFVFSYDSDCLYLQAKNVDDAGYNTIFKITRAGAITHESTISSSTDIEEIGN